MTAVLLACVGAALSPLLDVDRISVAGAAETDHADLIAASGLSTSDQLVLVDLEAARSQLQALPNISSASVVRQWPDAVRIEVLEEVPLVVLDRAGTRTVVSTTGRALGAPGGDESLPVLQVDAAPELVVGEDVPPAIRAATTVFARMSDTLRAELGAADLDAEGRLSFELPDEATLLFGQVEDVPAKLDAAEAMLSQVVRECLSRIDVREPRRPTAARVEGCVPPEPTTQSGTDPLPDATDDIGAQG